MTHELLSPGNILKMLREFTDVADFSYLFHKSIESFARLFGKKYDAGVIQEDGGALKLIVSLNASDWVHFPIELTTLPDNLFDQDSFFFELTADIPETRDKSFVFFPLSFDKRDDIFKINACFFVSSSILSAGSSDRNDLFVFIDILRFAVSTLEKFNKLRELTIVDDVTGLYNSRHLFAVLQQVLTQSTRYFMEFSLIFMDLDHFKNVNDVYGHIVGSKLLKEVGELLLYSLRKSDMAFRYGGDEFVIFLPYTSKQNAIVVVKRLHERLRSHVFKIENYNITITASFGLSAYPEDGNDVKSLIEKADMAMYRVKKASRDNWQLA